ncbi:MAG: tryptophan-rich sensory protein [Chitinophagaceae bacterium]|nr:tryptophan-rich sensory protein [Chitinophagaceae bacterium]
MNKTIKLIIAVAVPLIIGFTSGFFTETGEASWYQSINKPSWNPPNWIFAPVWTTLYVLMGIALFLVWNSNVNTRYKRTAIILFSIQLLLNFFWSLIFFNQQQPGWALVEIITLWIFILLTIFAFAKLSKTAAWLLVPYISWVSFAAILNYTLWKLNS